MTDTLVAPAAPVYSSNTFNAKIKSTVKSNKGFTIEAGTVCTLACGPNRVMVSVNGGIIKFGYLNAHKFFNCFEKQPSIRRLESMSNDGVCETPLGNRTEPDGHDEYGCPSWLLVMGVI